MMWPPLLMPTNQEFTTVPQELADGERHNDTLFEIKIENGKAGHRSSVPCPACSSLIHVPTRVAMWTHTTPLPEWGYKQAEINGNKKSLQSSNIWYVEEVPSIPAGCPSSSKTGAQVSTSGLSCEVVRAAARHVLPQQCSYQQPSVCK